MLLLSSFLPILLLPFAITTPADPPALGRRASPKPATPPALTRLWTATIQLAVTPVKSGSITGPALNGTVGGGVQYLALYDSGATQVPNIVSYGTASDGTPFLIRETGAGDQGGLFASTWRGPDYVVKTMQIIEIGGKYAALAKEFIVSDAKVSEDRKVVVTTAYKVEDR
ncbi:MAG: hypothetical protein LQ342_004989 [Letrouitia transgressa]|nr:MAG: hypothetical protein LQ342_004989 [Letrouitia transgressa]